MVVEALAMIPSVRNNNDDRDKGNTNMNEISEEIVSKHLANCNCSNPDNDGSVVSFESTANDQETTENDDLPSSVEAPAINNELRNDNINENVVIGDE